MIPLRDTIPTRTFPWVTIALIGANILVFLHQLGLGYEHGAAFVAVFGAVPAQFTGAAPHAAPVLPPGLTIATSMFLHGGLLHLLGNMVFLWIFGNNVEDATGHLRFLVFYLVCGAAAAAAHIVTHPASNVPMVGASGAISGVLGAYFLLYPHARIVTLRLARFLRPDGADPGLRFPRLLVPGAVRSPGRSAAAAGAAAWRSSRTSAVSSPACCCWSPSSGAGSGCGAR